MDADVAEEEFSDWGVDSIDLDTICGSDEEERLCLLLRLMELIVPPDVLYNFLCGFSGGIGLKRSVTVSLSSASDDATICTAVVLDAM